MHKHHDDDDDGCRWGQGRLNNRQTRWVPPKNNEHLKDDFVFGSRQGRTTTTTQKGPWENDDFSFEQVHNVCVCVWFGGKAESFYVGNQLIRVGFGGVWEVRGYDALLCLGWLVVESSASGKETQASLCRFVFRKKDAVSKNYVKLCSTGFTELSKRIRTLTL